MVVSALASLERPGGDAGFLAICAISSAEADEMGTSAPPPQALSATRAARAASRCVASKACFAVLGLAWVGFMSIIQKVAGKSGCSDRCGGVMRWLVLGLSASLGRDFRP